MKSTSLIPLLCVMYGVAFLGGFNENLANMALMSVMAEFSVDPITAQWLVSGYVIVATVVVTAMAFLYRRVKLRTLFFAASAANLAGSALGLWSPNFAVLLVARLIQAVGTGVFIPMMINTVLAVTPKSKLGTYMAIGSCVISCSPAFAPVICGSIVTAFGWRCIFAVPLVVMAVLMAAGAVFVRNLENEEAHLDIPPVAISAAALTLLSFGLAELTVMPAVAAVCIVVALACAGLFIVRQLRCTHPLIDLTPAKRATFWPTLIMVTVVMMSSFSTSVLLPLYFEGSIGMTAATAGSVILVPVLANVVITLFAGRVLDSRGEWPLLPLGYGIITVGFVVLVLVAPAMSPLLVVIGATVVFAGVGMVFSPSQTAGLRTLPPEENPFGVALSTTCVQVAACVGPALYTGIMSTRQLTEETAGVPAGLACADGFSAALVVAAVIAAVGFVTAFVYARKARARACSASRASAAGLSVGSTAPVPKLVRDFMDADPYVIAAGAPVREAMRAFADHRVSGMPVVDGEGHAVGFVSDGDIVRYLTERHPLITDAYSFAAFVESGDFDDRLRELVEMPVSGIASAKPVTVDAQAPIEEAFALLSTHTVKKVPVIADGVVVVTLNRSNVIRYAMDELAEPSLSPRSR